MADAEMWHWDTFFHSHKVFYFMSDVKEEDAPLNFAPGSQHLSLKRLWFEYKKSVTFKKIKGNAFEVSEREKSFLGFKNIKAIVPANTLVVFDGHGFHRRGDFSVGTKRSFMMLGFRYNPFSLKTHIVKLKKSEKIRNVI